MISAVLRRRLCDALIQRCVTRGQELAEPELERSALVFAPHPDDEVLGCGGTILRMRRYAAAVDIVFVTDGSRSHRSHVDAGELARRRQQEGLAAAALLGVEPGRVAFLGFEDSQLAVHADRARDRISALLADRRPAQVFVPYARDEHPDHRASNAIVHAALRSLDSPSVVYEYAVHLWWRWPWCGTAPDGTPYAGPRPLLAGLVASLRFLSQFRRFVRTHAVADAKRRALAAHVSQVSALLPGGPNLQQWSDGEFLAWAFCGYEFLRQRSELSSGSSADTDGWAKKSLRLAQRGW